MIKGSSARRAIGRGACVLGAAVLMAACVPDTGGGGSTTTTAPASTTTAAPTTTVAPTTTAPPTTTTTTAPPTTTTTSTTTTTIAAPTTVTKYTPLLTSCQGTALGQAQTSSNSTGITTVAPAAVAAGSNFVVKITPDPMVIPTSAGGQTIVNLNQVKIKIPVPTGSTFVSATLSGAANVGSGTPTVAQASGIITLTVPGNLNAGTTATLPTITLTLNATGAVGTQIQTILAGNSYANPGITFNVLIQLFSITVPTTCYVTPSPVFSSTPIQ